MEKSNRHELQKEVDDGVVGGWVHHFADLKSK